MLSTIFWGDVLLSLYAHLLAVQTAPFVIDSILLGNSIERTHVFGSVFAFWKAGAVWNMFWFSIGLAHREVVVSGRMWELHQTKDVATSCWFVRGRGNLFGFITSSAALAV